jgi:hypothetical protein
MELFITIAGPELNSKRAAKQLHQIADMIKAGVTEIDGFSIEYGGAFGMNVDFESNGPQPHLHADYWDGEGNHVHVNEDGFIVFRQGPDLPDGTPVHEPLLDQHIKLADWAAKHGGITPFGTPEAEDGHEH